MSNKITIVKVLGSGENITTKDLSKWREIFANNYMTAEQARATGEVDVFELPEINEDNHYITVVKVGGDEYSPTMEDLDNWRKVFEEAKDDPDFKIFTHPAVEIYTVNIGEIIAVE